MVRIQWLVETVVSPCFPSLLLLLSFVVRREALREGLCVIFTELRRWRSSLCLWSERTGYDLKSWIVGAKERPAGKLPGSKWKREGVTQKLLCLRESHDTYLGCRLPRFSVASAIKQKNQSKGEDGECFAALSLLLLWEEKRYKFLNRICELFPPNHQW